jgi:putative DNA primase/helicase
VLCSPRLGWQGASYLLPDKTYGPTTAEAIIYQPLSQVDHFFNTAGTLAEWQENVARLCVGNSRLVFAVSCAFAAPLLTPLGMESGGFHVRGTSSTGKTTAIRVAASVCGGGPGDGYVRFWRTTDNALEITAELHNDGLLCLDELAQLEPDKAGKVAYMLGNGRGKERMNDKGGSQRTASWKLLYLSTGEISLAQHARSAGGDWHGGQEVRCGDLPADAGAGMGLFENLHGSPTPAKFAEHLAAVSKRYYGTALREFLIQLCRNRDDLIGQVRSEIERFVAEQVPAGLSGEVTRMANRFGLVAVAGELTTSLGLTGWPQGDATRAAAACFQAWRSTHGSPAGTDAEEGIRRVRVFIAESPGRFQDLGDDSAKLVQKRAGFRTSSGKWGEEAETEYLFLTDCFQNEVCAGLDHGAVLAALTGVGYLRRDGDRRTVRKRFDGTQWSLYAISGKILEVE